MTASEKYQATFYWPHTEPSVVIVTGSFDGWSQSLRLQKREDGFKGTAELDSNEKIAYKFVVDGQWLVNNQEPTETDNSGNVNNVYLTPEKLSEAPRTNGILEESKLSSENAVDLATIIAATDGTSSALGYVASGVGAAIQGVIGIDPINPDQMSVKSPVSPFPPTSIAVTAATEESNPTTASSDTAPSSMTNEPSTHTPVNAAPLSPQVPSAVSAPPAEAEVTPSTHTPVQASAALSTEPPVETIPATPIPSATIPASSSVEASTHGPVVVPASPTSTPDAVTPASTPAVNSVTSVPAAEAVVPSDTTSGDTKGAIPAEPTTPTTPTKKTHLNGNGNENASTPVGSPMGSPAPRASTSSILSTPSKRSSRILSFPSRGSPTPDSSPSSKFESPSTRAKRKSIFGKMSIKNLFGKEKEKEKEK
ncbi:hypothetical protein GGU11DRAFT_68750 [Lentinula aff. detonsa]|nr:hypothetical protein GGU11DRAFT_68750 [Lentinula aff. detonsa]